MIIVRDTYLIDRILSVVFLIILSLAILFTKSLSFSLIVLSIFVIGAIILCEKTFVKPCINIWLTSSLSAFLAWSFISVLWTQDKIDAFIHVSIAILNIIAGYLIYFWIKNQDLKYRDQIKVWFIICYCLFTGLLALNLGTDLEFPEWIMKYFGFYDPNNHSRFLQQLPDQTIQIEPSILNANIAAINLLFWPVSLMGQSLLTGSKKNIFYVLTLLAVITATSFSSHESSKIALMFSLLIFLVAHLRIKAVFGLLVTIWFILVFFFVPISHFLYETCNLHEAKWLQRSAQERIMVWEDYSLRSHDTILYGTGLRNAHALNKYNTPTIVPYPNISSQVVQPHPHNVYLQTFYELGLIGSLLFFGIGLSILLYIIKQAEPLQKSLYGMYAFGIVSLGLCWDLWQSWHISMYVFSALGMALSQEILEQKHLKKKILN